MKNFDVIIIGAGAAGLMCAIRAGMRGKRVLLLDHSDKIGAKILISGGGRCNFTNLQVTPDRFLSENPHFCKSALSNYTQHDFIALVDKHKISYHEKTLGQLFCDHSAKDIVKMLLDECQANDVTIMLSQTVTHITRNDYFEVHTHASHFEAPSLVLATGGLSIPKMGATGFTYDIARQFNIPLTEKCPALVPLVFEGEELDIMRALSGVSFAATTACGKQSFHEGIVMTHRGLSGPAILQISSYWREGLPITVDMLPNKAVDFLQEAKRNRPKLALKNVLSDLLPQRLAQAMVTTYCSNQTIGDIPDKKLQAFASLLKGWRLYPTGSEGYAKAEVTLGGVSTKALSSKTMMTNDVSGLFIMGEAVDVTGWLGGYNFQWAWSSGWAAGSAV